MDIPRKLVMQLIWRGQGLEDHQPENLHHQIKVDLRCQNNVKKFVKKNVLVGIGLFVRLQNGNVAVVADQWEIIHSLVGGVGANRF
jgi:hypothetical protein